MVDWEIAGQRGTVGRSLPVACLMSSIPRAPMRIIGAPSTRNRHVAPIVRNAASLPPFLPHVFPSFLFVLGQRLFPRRCYASTSITCAALHPVQADHAPIFVFQLRRHHLPSSLPFLFFSTCLQTKTGPCECDAMHQLALLLL